MVDRHLRNAIENKKSNYFCKKHQRIHKYGTKIWERDLSEIVESKSNISEAVKKEVRKLKKSSTRGGKAYQLEREKEIQDVMTTAVKEAETTLNKGRYFVYELMYFYEGRKPEIRIIGRTNGYVSFADAVGDRYVASDIAKARKSKESTIFVTKATLIKTIGK